MRVRTVTAVAVVLAVLTAACGGTSAPSGALVASDLERRAPDAPAADLADLAAGNNAFATEAYARLIADQEGNLVFSPASIRLALAMAYAGAAGRTAEEMAQVLHFDLDDAALHAAFNSLDQALASRNHEETGPDGETRRVLLSIANSLWGQSGFEFVPSFLDTLAANYGAGMRIVDFVKATETARTAINDWVAEATHDRITDFIPEGALNEMTRLVLTNAVYLDATWASTFEEDDTWEAPFFLLDGSEVTAETMHQDGSFRYAAGDGWQAVELPYVGEQLAMLFVLPDEGHFAEVEGRLSAGLLDEALAALESTQMTLGLPRFEFDFKAGLTGLLAGLGMPTAFDPATADFSGISTADDLYISDVIHQAFIKVDEEGTEAAAATGVVMGVTSAPVATLELLLDHPFLFSLYDRETGEILFLGRVLNPAE